jgi:hypothetical protein
VGEKDQYIISKALLCQSSGYFRAALEGGWRETTEQEIDLQDEDPEAFEMLIQYLYTGKVVIASAKLEEDHHRHGAGDAQGTNREFWSKVIKFDNTVLKTEAFISRFYTTACLTRYLKFVVLHQRLLIDNGITIIINSMKHLLKNDVHLSRYALTGDHVRTAMELPRRHPVRQLFAKAAVWDYCISTREEILDLFRKDHYVFWLQKEVEELEGFAADLLPFVGKIFCDHRLYCKDGARPLWLAEDPLTSFRFDVVQGAMWKRPLSRDATSN